jgi:hypothetical protein
MYGIQSFFDGCMNLEEGHESAREFKLKKILLSSTALLEWDVVQFSVPDLIPVRAPPIPRKFLLTPPPSCQVRGRVLNLLCTQGGLDVSVTFLHRAT